MTDCPTWLIMSDWSWVNFWATQDPVENVRKQSWNSEQNNAEINFGLTQIFITQTEILRHLLFPNPHFLPKSLWSSTCLCAVLSPWTRTPMLGASLPEKVETRNTQSRLESSMRHGIPYTNVLSSASSWEFSVFVHLAAHIHSTCSCVTPSNRKWCLSYSYIMWSVYRWEKIFGSPQTFTLSIFLSLAIKFGWSWKVGGAVKKAGSNKGLSWGNWGTN